MFHAVQGFQRLFCLFLLGMFSFSAAAVGSAAHIGHLPGHHVKHNMVLFGTQEFFASHIVYNVPHNFQLIIELKLSAIAQAKVRQARADYPSDLVIFLLDHVEQPDLKGASKISGTLQRKTSSGQKIELLSNLEFQNGEFSVVYFGELPESLAAQ